MLNLKKRKPDHELEEGEVAPRKDNKQQKITKDPRDEAEVRLPQWTWAPRIEMEGAPIPYDASIWDSQRGHANYLV